jgi:hypothetical protein
MLDELLKLSVTPNGSPCTSMFVLGIIGAPSMFTKGLLLSLENSEEKIPKMLIYTSKSSTRGERILA